MQPGELTIPSKKLIKSPLCKHFNVRSGAQRLQEDREWPPLGRRQFFATVGLGLLATTRVLPAQRPLRFGLHLSNLRLALEADLEGTLRTIAGLGYKEIELGTADGVRVDALATRRLLDEFGLTAPSRHVRMPDLFSNWRALLRECQVLGTRHVVSTEIPEPERATLAGYERVAALMNAAGKITRSAGMQLVLHHHPDDFRPRDQVVPYEYLLRSTDSELVKIQVDLSVMARAGRDPLEDFARYPGRFASAHVNDIAEAPDQEPVSLGQGRIDLARILARGATAGLQYYFIDDERPDSPWEHAEANLAYLSQLRF